MENGEEKSKEETSKEETSKEENNQRSKKVIEPKITITTTVNASLHAKAKKNKISWRKALEIGINVLLNE